MLFTLAVILVILWGAGYDKFVHAGRLAPSLAGAGPHRGHHSIGHAASRSAWAGLIPAKTASLVLKV
jgi:hypothetical protein